MKLTANEMTKISILAALSFIGGLISIPFGPVPITLQTLFVLLSGLVLSPRGAFISQALQIVLSLLIRGAQIVMVPSFGFLVGFLLAAPMLAWLKQNKHIENNFWLVSIGTVVIYLVGTPYMAFILNVILGAGMSFSQIMLSGVLLFLPGDVMKGILAVIIAKRLTKVKAVKMFR